MTTSKIDYVGESDWEDQDLLFHQDARDRVVKEIESMREQIRAASDDSSAERLRHRLGLLEERLVTAERAINRS